MASSGKKKTTMAKLTRENKLRERRLDKKAKKDARKLGLLPNPNGLEETLSEATDESGLPLPDAGQDAREPVGQALADV
jgi:hypothetical protein